jgi:DNA repair exonuclease SbcCD ATPase subunit
MSNVNTDAAVLAPEQIPATHGGPDGDNSPPAADDQDLLRHQNAALRAKVEELEQQIASTGQIAEERWVELQREYETLIEEKSETIRTLHHKNTELRERGAAAPAAAPAPEVAAVPPDREDLLRLQTEVLEQRRQMKEDEESMMGQMRQMEMSLAKDRAEMARQRAELQRLRDDLQHELDVAARDGGLRERLGALQRAATTLTTARGPARQETPQASPKPTPVPNPPASTPPRSGLFRRMFSPRQ